MTDTGFGQQGLSIWEEEAKKLGQGGNYLKLEDNVPYYVTFLDEGVETKDVVRDKKTGMDKEIVKRVFKVKVSGGKGVVFNGDEKTWDVPLGGTAKSLYGKLVELFKANKTAVGYSINIAKDFDKDGKPQYKVLEWNALDNARVFKQK